MILPLVLYPDPRLKTKSAPVEKVTDAIRQLAADMLETMYYERGVGLAAVQVGILQRVLVADVDWSEDGTGKAIPGSAQWVLINPEILESSEQPHIHKEGCLSFPDQFAEVERPAYVRVRFLDEHGKQREERFEGLMATCVQHEIDHLNGIVFPDRVSSMKRDIIFRKARKIKKSIEDHHHEHVHDEHCNHG